MKTIVIASDSFKGSLSSRQVADIVGESIREVFPACRIVKISIADGGEGTAEVLVDALDGRFVRLTVHDPLMRPVTARFGAVDKGKTAVMEAAGVCGLTLLSAAERNPIGTTTFGLGEMIAYALDCGYRRFLLGLGGMATNDGGTGMLQALGFRFFDKDGAELAGTGENLIRIHAFDSSSAHPALREAEFRIACDVDNPFYGPTGAACVFARQKGADDGTVELLDRGLEHFASVIAKTTERDVQTIPGAGAAGGLGGAFAALLGASLERGIDIVLDIAGFDEKIKDADLVITGEGKMDSQTKHGKAPMGVLRRCKAQHVPVIAFCGIVEEDDALAAMGFTSVFPIVPGPATIAEATDMAAASQNLGRTSANVLRLIKQFDRS